MKEITGFEGSVLVAGLLQLLFQLKKISLEVNKARSYLDKENAKGVDDAEDDAIDEKGADHDKPGLK